MKVTTCRSCSARIWFGLTAKGRRLPVDEKPARGGNVVISATLFSPANADEPEVKVLGPDPAREGAFTSHFQTCPDAERFRRAR